MSENRGIIEHTAEQMKTASKITYDLLEPTVKAMARVGTIFVSRRYHEMRERIIR